MGANKIEPFTAYARPGSRDPEFTVRPAVRRSGAARRGERSQVDAVGMPNPPDAIMPYENVDSHQGPAARCRDDCATARLQGRASVAFQQWPQGDRHGSNRYSGSTQGGSIPGRWYGYDAARAIVVDTGELKAFCQLSEAASGQRLSNGSRTRRPYSGWSPLGQLAGQSARQRPRADSPRPSQRAGTGLRRLSALETFVGLKQADHALGSKAVMVTKLDEIKRQAVERS